MWTFTFIIGLFGFAWMVSEAGRRGVSQILAPLVTLATLASAWVMHFLGLADNNLYVVLMPMLLLSAFSFYRSWRRAIPTRRL